MFNMEDKKRMVEALEREDKKRMSVLEVVLATVFLAFLYVYGHSRRRLLMELYIGLPHLDNLKPSTSI